MDEKTDIYEQKIRLARNNPSKDVDRFSNEEKEAIDSMVNDIVAKIKLKYRNDETAEETAWEVLSTPKSVRNAFANARATSIYSLYMATQNLFIRYIDRSLIFRRWKTYHKKKPYYDTDMLSLLVSVQLSPLDIAIHNEERQRFLENW